MSNGVLGNIIYAALALWIVIGFATGHFDLIGSILEGRHEAKGKKERRANRTPEEIAKDNTNEIFVKFMPQLLEMHEKIIEKGHVTIFASMFNDGDIPDKAMFDAICINLNWEGFRIEEKDEVTGRLVLSRAL